jgi:hypothetical protein
MWWWFVSLPAVLVGLYEEPERPPNAVDYIKKYLGAPVGVDIDALRAENDRLKTENRSLHQTVEELNKRVCVGGEHEQVCAHGPSPQPNELSSLVACA